MKYSLKQTSSAAAQICRILLTEQTTPEIVCSLTGKLIKPGKDWETASSFSGNALGAYYKAHGFYYILCWAEPAGRQYVEVYREHDKKLVAIIEKPEEAKVVSGCF